METTLAKHLAKNKINYVCPHPTLHGTIKVFPCNYRDVLDKNVGGSSTSFSWSGLAADLFFFIISALKIVLCPLIALRDCLRYPVCLWRKISNAICMCIFGLMVAIWEARVKQIFTPAQTLGTIRQQGFAWQREMNLGQVCGYMWFPQVFVCRSKLQNDPP